MAERNIELEVAWEMEGVCQTVLIDIIQTMNILTSRTNNLETGINQSVSPEQGDYIKNKQVLTRIKPYKNSLDNIFKSLYDVKLKIIDELKEIETVKNSVV